MTDAPQHRPWWRTPWWRGTRERRVLLVAEIVLIGLVAAGLGLLAGGNLNAAVGPLQTRLSVAPSFGGGTTVAIPPLGELRVHSHAGPWALTAEVTRINGVPGLLATSDGQPVGAVSLDLVDGRIAALRFFVNPDKLKGLDLRRS